MSDAKTKLIDALNRYLRQDETAGDTDNGVYRQGQEAMSAALTSAPAERTAAWGKCPICLEGDMPFVKVAEDEPALIRCNNHACRSNGGEYDARRAPALTPQAAGAIDARERFEKWARERGHDTHRSAGTGYLVYSVQVMWMAWQEAIASPQEAPPAAGWKLVPTEATRAMQDAWDTAPSNENCDVEFGNAYRAMIAAAPPAAGAAQAVAALRDALRKIASSSGGEDGCYYTNRANIRIATAALKAPQPGERGAE